MTSPANFIIHTGTLRPATDPILCADDSLAACGRGVFETLPSHYGKLFLPAPHMARLRLGAAMLDLPCPDDELLLRIIPDLLIANDLDQVPLARVRITLTASRVGSSRWWIEATLPPPHPQIARIISSPFTRNDLSPLSGHKITSCADSHLAQKYAHERGADESLFTNSRGEICEGAWSNIFVKIDHRWITPPLDSGCLPGITRALVIDLFRENALEIVESTLYPVALYRVESAFLTSSLRGIQPISAIDEHALSLAPEIGTLQSAYQRKIASL